VTRAKKRWSDLTPMQHKAIIAGGAVELALTAVALCDLAQRPADEIRGRKWQWVLAFALQPFGPLAYLTNGRRSTD
jgi:hypothetical protein